LCESSSISSRRPTRTFLSSSSPLPERPLTEAEAEAVAEVASVEADLELPRISESRVAALAPTTDSEAPPAALLTVAAPLTVTRVVTTTGGKRWLEPLLHKIMHFLEKNYQDVHFGRIIMREK
jgi:hypothetical protein